MQRLALILFGALLIALFVGFAVAQGLGRESVPEGDVAIVEGVPDGANTVSEAELKRATLQQALQGGLKKLPKEDSSQFEELRRVALGELLDFIWIQAQADELGIRATKKQNEAELEKIKEQNFPTEAAYEEFLKSSKLTVADVEQRIELQVLSSLISEAVNRNATLPSSGEISDYYEAAKANQFTTEASRDVRIVTNKDKAEVEAAKAELEKDDSPANWKKVAEKYSSDPTTGSKGGLQRGLTEKLLATAGPFKEAIFGSASNELIGPIKFQGNYTLIEVVRLKPEKVQTLAEVRSQISSTLQQQAREAVFERFIADYQSKWESRTICNSDVAIERCSNFRGDGRPLGANPACYEADPKAPATECPSLVTPIKPTVPGKVTILQPKGEPLVQRPVPASAAAGAPTGGGEELPEGAEAAPGE